MNVCHCTQVNTASRNMYVLLQPETFYRFPKSAEEPTINFPM